MRKLIRTFLLLFILITSLSFQTSMTQIHVPHSMTLQAIKSQDVSKDLVEKSTELPDEMRQFMAEGHILGFRKGDIFIASADHALRIEFINARSVSPMNEGISPDSNNTKQAEKQLGKLVYKDLWDGVTLSYERHGSGVVKSTYTVQPSDKEGSSAVDQIRLRYNVPVEVDNDGSLVFSFKTGQMRESMPLAWQEIKRERIPVEVSFRSLGEREVGFKVGSHDLEIPLVIDPVISWNTFMGGNENDFGHAIAVDGVGNVYVTGTSVSTWGTPVNPFAGYWDAFVVKLSPSGELLWNTFMGSSFLDVGSGIAVDESGSIFVTGYSSHSWGPPIHPFTSELDQSAFVAKLHSSGVRLWVSFIDKSLSGNGIAVDGSGNVHVTGSGYDYWDYMYGPWSYGAFIMKLDSSGVLLWDKRIILLDPYFTPPEVKAYAITLDGSGNVYVTGTTEGSLPFWPCPTINSYTGGWDAFVVKLDSNGGFKWSTFMGSSDYDEGNGISVDGNGNIFVTGTSESTWGTPINSHAGGQDAFVAKLDSSGERQWHTFMGSSIDDTGKGIAVDGSGNVYIAGGSDATWGTPVNSFAGGVNDAYAVKLNSSGNLQWNTFMGSSIKDIGKGMAVDGSRNVYVVGYSRGTWGMPVNEHSGQADAFVAKLNPNYVMNIYVFDGHDFNGNGSSDVSVFRPPNGRWYIKGIGSYIWGTAGDIPVNGDYNGDGTTDIAVWRPLNGRWYLRGIGGTSWGTSGDIPVPRNYDGDVNGTTDIAIWRPSNGRWYIKGVGNYVWGTVGDFPVPGDYNGDGTTEIAVWRPSNGRWYIKGVAGSVWGMVGDIPVPADYNGDGKTEIAVWRPSNGRWYIKGVAGAVWGASGDIPAPGDYNGDGNTDIAVWRPSNGRWYIKGIGGYIWGMLGDIPLVR